MLLYSRVIDQTQGNNVTQEWSTFALCWRVFNWQEINETRRSKLREEEARLLSQAPGMIQLTAVELLWYALIVDGFDGFDWLLHLVV